MLNLKSITFDESLKEKYKKLYELLEEVVDCCYEDYDGIYKISEIINEEYSGHICMIFIYHFLRSKDDKKLLNLVALLKFFLKVCHLNFKQYLCHIDFLEELHLITQGGSEKLTTEILSFIDILYNRCKVLKNFKNVSNLYTILNVEGHKFPATDLNEYPLLTMESYKIPPKWINNDFCSGCHIKFGTLVRKHHCRNCGNIFCKSCSSKLSELRLMNILEKNRICEDCYEEINSEMDDTVGLKDMLNQFTNQNLNGNLEELPAKSKSREQEDLKRAIELSLQDYNNEQKNRKENETLSNIEPYKNLENFELPAIFQENEPKNSKLPIPSNLFVAQTRYTTPNSVMNGNDFPVTNQFLDSFNNSLQSASQRMNNPNSDIMNDSVLQNIFQTLLSMQIQMEDKIKGIDSQIEFWNFQLKEIEKIKRTRHTLDENRLNYKHRIDEQRQEAEIYLKLQVEQKMELLRQQKKQNEEFQKSIINSIHNNLEDKQELPFYGIQIQATMPPPHINIPNYIPPQEPVINRFQEPVSYPPLSNGNPYPQQFKEKEKDNPQEGKELIDFD